MNYTVMSGNETCLIVLMSAHFEYIGADNKTAVANVTSSFKADPKKSDCSTLQITDGSNFVKMVFDKSADNKTYTLNETSVGFSEETAAKKGLHIGNVAMKASYVCKSGETVAFDNGDKLVIKDLQYQAFVVEDGKFATATTCSQDDFNAVIPIVVGCVLSALVLIVVVAYLVGRRAPRHGYEEI